MDEKYVNSLNVSTGAYDVIIRFFKESAIESEGKPEILKEEVATLRMSPQLSKALCSILTDNIKNYEETFGNIPLPTLTTAEVNKK